MSAEEKETYFDGPHLSSGESQPYNLRFPQPEVPMQNFEASSHTPGTSQQQENSTPATSDPMKSSGPFQHLNGGGPPMGFQAPQLFPSIFVPTSIHALTGSSPNQPSASADQPLPESSQFNNVPAVFPPSNVTAVVRANEAPSSSHQMAPSSRPMETYMNIANNMEQQFVGSIPPQENILVPPLAAIEHPPAENNVSSVRCEHAEMHSNAFPIHPGPSFTSGLHQNLSEGRNRRNAEDILHSQGSWPSQSYSSSASDYQFHQPQISGVAVVANDEASAPPDAADPVLELPLIEQAMNNLAVSDTPPVQNVDLNIEADLDESESSSTNSDAEEDAASEEKLLVSERIDVGIHELEVDVVTSPDLPGHVTSTLHPTADETGTSIEAVALQPSVSGDAPSAIVAPCPSSLRDHPLHVLPVETLECNQKLDHEPSEPPRAQFDQGESEIKPPVSNVVTQPPSHPAMGDAFVRESVPSQNPTESDARESVLLFQDDAVPFDAPPPPPPQPTCTSSSNLHETGNNIVVDTQSMHSSYVSMQPPAVPAAAPLSHPSTTPAPLTAAPPSATTSQSVEHPSPSGGLRSQMIVGEYTSAPLHPPENPTAPLHYPENPTAPLHPPENATSSLRHSDNPPLHHPGKLAEVADTSSLPHHTAYVTNPHSVATTTVVTNPLPTTAPVSTYPPPQTTPYAHIPPANAYPISSSLPPSTNFPPSSYHQMQHPRPSHSGYSGVPTQDSYYNQTTHLKPHDAAPTSEYHPQPASQAPYQPSEQTGHVTQSTNQLPDQSRQSSNFPHPSSDPNIQRSAAQHHWDRRNDTQFRDTARPHSSMSGAEPSYAPPREDWHNRSDNYGMPRRDRYSRDSYNPRWSHDQRDYDAYYRSYGNYGYGRDGGYYRDYEQYYRQQRAYQDYYERQYYDQYGRPYRDQWSGYYPSYRHRGYDEDEDRHSVYSERSAHHRYNDTYNTSYQDPSMAPSYFEDPSINDSYYPNTYEVSQQPQPEVPSRRTPAKFSCAHPVARFGAGGHLVVIMPQQSAEQSSSSLQVHSIETLLHKNKEAEHFQKFPGPLSKSDTHKNDVVQFITSQSRKCAGDTSLVDRQSATLVWDFLALMVRQNGSVLGTDVSELLMRDHSGDFGLLASPNETQERLASTSHEEAPSAPDSDSAEQQASGHGRAMHVCPSVRFRELLLHGRKKDALEWAMQSSLWGHALLLASKTDARTHATVMLQFANSLPINDPLQTLYQLMSGRQPASTTCVADEGWGGWRPHMAMILSNSTENASLDTKMLLTMGDTLWTRGLVDAAHFCYLMAPVPLGFYAKKSNKLVLIGSNHMRPFEEFASNTAIQRTETYEYASALSASARHPSRNQAHFPSLQIYKFIYACRMLEYGMVAKAFHYFENISRLVIHSPSSFSLTLVRQLCAVVEQLRLHDSRVQAGTLRDSDLEWTRTLNAILEKMMGGSIVPSTTSYARSSPLSDVPSSEDLSESHHPAGGSEESDESDDEETDVDELDKYPSSGRPDLHVQQPSYTQPSWQQMPGHNYQPEQATDDQRWQEPTNEPGVPTFAIPSHQTQSLTHLPQHGPPQTNQAPAMFAIDQQLSQASMPNLVPTQPPFQPHMQQAPTQWQSTPNSSMVPQLPPSPEEPRQDFYDHFAKAPPVELISGSRMRTESQTSFGSRRSRLSKRSSGRRTRTVSERSQQSRSRSTSAESEKKAKESQKQPKAGWGILNWFHRKQPEKPKAHRAHLPDDSDKGIQWDAKLNRWVDLNATEEERPKTPEPPPMDGPTSDLVPNASQAPPDQRSMYKNAFSSSTTSTNNVVPPPVLPPAGHPSLPATGAPMFTPTPANSQVGGLVGNAPSQPHSNPVVENPPMQPAHHLPTTQQEMPQQNSMQYRGGPVTSQPVTMLPFNTSQPPHMTSQQAPAMVPQGIPLDPVSSNAATEVPPNNEAGPPAPAPFYNPAAFVGGPNLFSQPTAAAQQRKRGYPTMRK